MSEFNFNENIYLGANCNERPMALQRDARLRHLYIVGQIGTGKSTLLLNLLMQDLERFQDKWIPVVRLKKREQTKT